MRRARHGQTLTSTHISNPKHRPSRRFAICLIALCALALAVRSAYVVLVSRHHPLNTDAVVYRALGLELARGDGYLEPFTLAFRHLRVPTAGFPPGYPIVLAVIDFLGGRALVWQLLVGSCIGTTTVALTGLVGRRVGGDKVGLAAAALAVGYPMLFVADGTAMSESLFALQVSTVLLLLYVAYEHPTMRRWLAIGVVAGLAALTRGEGVLLLPCLVLPGAIAAHRRQPRRAVCAFAAVIFVVAAVLTPWELRNRRAFGKTVLISNNSGTLVGGANCETTYHGVHLGSWDVLCVRLAAPPKNEVSISEAQRRHGLDYLRHHLGRLPVVVAVRVARTFGFYDPLREVRWEAAYESRPHGWQVAGWIVYLVMLSLAIPGAVIAMRKRLRVGPLVGSVVMVVITTSATYGNQRFRITAEPTILVLAAVALVAVVDSDLAGHVRRRRVSLAPKASQASATTAANRLGLPGQP